MRAALKRNAQSLLPFPRAQLSLFALLALSLIVSNAACVKRQRAQSPAIKANDQQSASSIASPAASPKPRININLASAKELEVLPGVGPAMAARIVEHREKYGPFRRPEHLIMVRGLSDKRFRTLRELIDVK
jgi:competence ComEA-like helix-hairpin-helix protein